MATFGIWHQLLRLHYLPYPEWTECSVQVVARLVLNSGFLNNNAPTNHLSITKGALEKLPKSSLQETKISNRLSAPGMPLRAATQRTPALQQKDADGTRASCARLDSFSNFSCCRGQPEMERQRAVKLSTRARGNRPSDDQCSVRKFPGCRLFLMQTGDWAAKSRWNWQTGLCLAVCRLAYTM